MDKTPPANLLIAVVAVFSVIVLMGLKPLFDAYYSEMRQVAIAAQQERYQPERAVREARTQWSESLHNGAMPIEEAMSQVAQGRGRIPAIAPRRDREMNLDPLRGWAQLRQEVPEGAEPPPPAPAPARRMLLVEPPTEEIRAVLNGQ